MRGWMFVSLCLAVTGCQKPVETLGVSPETLLLTSQGQQAHLALKALDEDGRLLEVQIKHFSSDETVATVGSDGKITAHKSGDATIELEAGGQRAQVSVQVRIPASVELLPESIVLIGLGSTEKLTARVADEEGREVVGAAVSWAVDGPGCVAVVSGTVTAIGVGTCRVSASFGLISANSQVTVQLPEFESLALEPPSLALTIGQQELVLASMTNAEGKRVAGVPVAFETSPSEVASVDSSGRVTGLAPGETTLTAHAGSRSVSIAVSVRAAK